jgi:hypothetical protein
MHRRTPFASTVALLAMAACAPIPEPAPVATRAPAVAPTVAPASIEYTDLTDDFALVWERTKGMPDAQKVAAFRAHFEPVIPGFYDREQAGPFKYADLIARALNEYPEKRTGIEQVSANFAAMAVPARTSFEAAFGPMGEMPPIILLHTLGEMDGGVRTMKATGRTLLFGADVIARNHLKHGIQPFFHHELFHVFHERRFKGCDAVWCGLWTEGLAVYVAERLNPGANDAQLLLVNPVPLRAAVEANRKAALCTVLARLNSTDETDHAALFSGGEISDDLPSRAGYYIGYLVAADVGETHSLPQLAAMPAEQVRPLVEASLRRLAECG